MFQNDRIERIPLSVAVLYCSILSASFVGSLYYFIPPSIRILDRDDHRQIKWRTTATLVVCAVSTWSQSWLFPLQKMPSLTLQQSVQATLGVFSHTALLYMGPITQMFFHVAIQTQKKQQQEQQQSPSSKVSSLVSLPFNFLKTWYSFYIAPIQHSFFYTISSNERWACLRNRIIAPVVEEILFRKCMVPILWATGMSTTRTVLVAPIFFGAAHLHHAFLRWNQAPALTVLLQTLFQFLYTSLFGSYAAYAYLRTGSIGAAILSHAFCNGMGLPDLVFARPFSSLYPHRYVLGCAHLGGILCFAWGFRSTWLLPNNQFILHASQ